VRVIETGIAGVLIIEPDVFGDERGFFMESYQADRFAEAGIVDNFVQANHSRSGRATLRGLHYQLPHAQSKLCRVVVGEVLDVVVDIRRSSPTFGRVEPVVLSAENHRQIYVPAGMAHGFAVLSSSADFLYMCGDYYHPKAEHGIAWDDPDLKIDWPFVDPILSERDRRHPRLRDVHPSLLPD